MNTEAIVKHVLQAVKDNVIDPGKLLADHRALNQFVNGIQFNSPSELDIAQTMMISVTVGVFIVFVLAILLMVVVNDIASTKSPCRNDIETPKKPVPQAQVIRPVSSVEAQVIRPSVQEENKHKEE